MALADIQVDSKYIASEITPSLNLITICRINRKVVGIVFVAVQVFRHILRCAQVLQGRTELTGGVRARTNLNQKHHHFLNFFASFSLNQFTLG